MEQMQPNPVQKRWQLLDILRGLSVCLMILHHLAYYLYFYGLAPRSLYSNPVVDVLHYVFLGIFILLCGISCHFSRSNVKRGLKLVICAGALTAASYLIDNPMLFGILHFLALAILFYAAIKPLVTKWPVPLCFVLDVLLFAGSWHFIRTTTLGWKILWFFGKTEVLGWGSSDYVQIFPWLFVFLFGTVLGRVLVDRTPPEPSHSAAARFLSWVGRRSLTIYLLHLPVLVILTKGLALLLGSGT